MSGWLLVCGVGCLDVSFFPVSVGIFCLARLQQFWSFSTKQRSNWKQMLGSFCTSKNPSQTSDLPYAHSKCLAGPTSSSLHQPSSNQQSNFKWLVEILFFHCFSSFKWFQFKTIHIIINIWATQKFPQNPDLFRAILGGHVLQITNRFAGIPKARSRLSEPAFRRAIGPMSHPGHGVEQGPQLGLPQADGGSRRSVWLKKSNIPLAGISLCWN